MNVTYDDGLPLLSVPTSPQVSNTVPMAVDSHPPQPSVTVQPLNSGELSQALAMALHGQVSLSEEEATQLCGYFGAELEADAVAGLKHMIGPAATWSSPYQHLLVLLVLSEHQDFIGVLPTGAGKSLAWNIYAWIKRKSSVIVVVIPNKSLLEEQLRRSTSKGIQAQKLSAQIITNWKAAHDKAPLWFVPLETFTSSKWPTCVLLLSTLVLSDRHMNIVLSERSESGGGSGCAMRRTKSSQNPAFVLSLPRSTTSCSPQSSKSS